MLGGLGVLEAFLSHSVLLQWLIGQLLFRKSRSICVFIETIEEALLSDKQECKCGEFKYIKC